MAQLIPAPKTNPSIDSSHEELAALSSKLQVLIQNPEIQGELAEVIDQVAASIEHLLEVAGYDLSNRRSPAAVLALAQAELSVELPPAESTKSSTLVKAVVIACITALVSTLAGVWAHVETSRYDAAYNQAIKLISNLDELASAGQSLHQEMLGDIAYATVGAGTSGYLLSAGNLSSMLSSATAMTRFPGLSKGAFQEMIAYAELEELRACLDHALRGGEEEDFLHPLKTAIEKTEEEGRIDSEEVVKINQALKISQPCSEGFDPGSLYALRAIATQDLYHRLEGMLWW